MSYAQTVQSINNKIEIAKNNSDLSAKEITLLAASKSQPVERIAMAIEAGVMVFGENRVQEVQAKWPALRRRFPQLRLHLIGPLQTNKVKVALELFDVIETIDRPRLADAIARERAAHPVASQRFFIQVNIGREPQKAGVMPEEADALIRYCRGELKLPVTGLMCVPPVQHPPAPYFALLREIAQRHGLSELSMGMSDDYETAVRMGSTCIRLGRALFGEESRKAV